MTQLEKRYTTQKDFEGFYRLDWHSSAIKGHYWNGSPWRALRMLFHEF